MNEGGGECGDFTTLVVNLLRYKGIPSRHNICLGLDGGYHVWADFYLEGYGWIPLDATYKNSNRSGDYFGKYHGDCVVVAQDLDYKIDGISELWFLQSFCYWYWCSGNVDFQAYHKTDIIENSGVECVSTQKEESADVYNLQGIKVSPEYKGVVISKGKLRIRK